MKVNPITRLKGRDLFDLPFTLTEEVLPVPQVVLETDIGPIKLTLLSGNRVTVSHANKIVLGKGEYGLEWKLVRNWSGWSTEMHRSLGQECKSLYRLTGHPLNVSAQCPKTFAAKTWPIIEKAVTEWIGQNEAAFEYAQFVFCNNLVLSGLGRVDYWLDSARGAAEKLVEDMEKELDKATLPWREEDPLVTGTAGT